MTPEGAADNDNIMDLRVTEVMPGIRLDRHLLDALTALGQARSRSELQNWIKDGRVLVNGRPVKASHQVAIGDHIHLDIPVPAARLLQGEELDLKVLFEDEHLIVINKAAGMVVHPGSGNKSGTLVNALHHHCQGRLSILAGEDRPGIVHRLDKDTSGCLVAAKTDAAYHSLVGQFSARNTHKEYLAVTDGVPVRDSGTISNRIGRHPKHRQKMAVVPEPAGKEALTSYRTIRTDSDGAWATLLCVIHTGRTHQIRVHLKENLRCPILGDPIYGKPGRQKQPSARLMLHAWHLELDHPLTTGRLSFEAPLPDTFLPFV